MVNTLPEPHRYAVCASEGMPIKQFYDGVYEEVFIFFHPFMKQKHTEKETVRTTWNKNNLSYQFEVRTWKEFLHLSKITTVHQLDIGLRTRILALTKEKMDEETALAIDETCQQYNLITPGEGRLPEILINPLLKSVQQLGYFWIWCGNEFGTERKLEAVSDLISKSKLPDDYSNFFTHYNELLITTHWDSHFSMLCGTKEVLEAVRLSCQLEGFYCNHKTDIYWSVTTC
ncbi:hypothetical protein CAI16_19860 [Virgibacillus dokdonensis]|uniref:DUF2711 domain-containing protein n=1 Tax=Virgibacillus dokdonensis TaxID=302167 RepID=A0A3E0WFR2_9BACI|nr:DUF2711 family protein [Virgibacillus dokdonensis]RFA31784.1 hypothetical protein CAI16_19860 [Virgibacillus dokdonensis]